MIHLDGSSLTLDDLVAIAHDDAPVALADAARARVRAARAVVDAAAQRDTPTYGINTGFGNFADVRIPHESLAELQVNLLRSHAAGVGEPLLGPGRARDDGAARQRAGQGLLRHPPRDARAAGRAAQPARASGRAVARIGRRQRRPRAAGASRAGPHRRRRSVARPANASLVRSALARVGVAPASLAPKEGLALINGTQPSTALLGLALAGALQLARAADIAAALSIDGLQGSTKPFDPRIHEARGLAGQRASADNLRTLLAGSGINAAHANCGRVQDAYSMRCAAAGARRGARSLRLCPPDRSTPRPTPRPTTRWSSPTRARSSPAATFTARRWRRRRRAVPRPRAAGDDQRATLRSARQPVEQRAARVPHPPRRPAVGADDGAGDRGRAHLRAEDARASGERGHDPDIGQQGRSRQHEHGARR